MSSAGVPNGVYQLFPQSGSAAATDNTLYHIEKLGDLYKIIPVSSDGYGYDNVRGFGVNLEKQSQGEELSFFERVVRGVTNLSGIFSGEASISGGPALDVAVSMTVESAYSGHRTNV